MIAHIRFKGVHWMLLAVIALAPAVVQAQQVEASQGQSPQQEQPTTTQTKAEETPAQPEAAQANGEKDPKVISGMSILGNQEAPKSLVIVPWKSSEIGAAMGVSTMLDDSRQPIDKEVFMRMLSYHEVRSKAPGTAVASTKTKAAPAITVAQGRKP